MDFQNTLEFALQLDEQDSLKHFRKEFLIPQHAGKDAIYLCGNSLGLQPVSAQKYIAEQLSSWQNLAVEGWFDGDAPWLSYHKQVAALAAPIVGAKISEVSIMNSLTVNLHLLMVSFYKPTANKFKIIMEGGAFPSDQYAVESQVKFHGYVPADAVIEIFPREGEYTLCTEDILKTIEENKDELALVLFGGINYYTGQYFDIEAITKAGHAAGAYVGIDLAHAAGNVAVKLHDWDVDFACWCSYKYMNAGPGGISGIFVHEKHFNDTSLNRFTGWWGYREDKRFLMAPGFDPAVGAEGWQVSTSPILLLALYKASLDVFERAGGIDALRVKGDALTAYLEFLIKAVNDEQGEEVFKIITPETIADRGSQLSLICKRDGKAIFNYLTQNGIIGDWREPNAIRLSPVPLYNSFVDVFNAARHLSSAAGL
ncbi:kynureninase [Mucilaginibacter gynuensis]|uniref:Kynureninase n=1 Tax=Mucilaginibacter gynuensis TaxID=1302236 RepID=A0ABP8FQJ2_9SPHI